MSQTGWPYAQHRGGGPRLLRVLDATTLSFIDGPGNRQFISVGNLAQDDRVAVILVDYQHRQRIKILGRLLAREMLGEGRPQRDMTIRVEPFDRNCSQHIPMRFEAEEVQRALDERDLRIAAPDSELQALRVRDRPPGSALAADLTRTGEQP